MAVDTINVTSVSAYGGVGQITYNILTDAPGGTACLPYEGISRIEVWVSSGNNRSGATKAGDAHVSAMGIQYTITNLGVSTTRYAWFRAVNIGGNIGAWYPVSETGGVSATTSNQVPPDGSITENKIVDGAVTAAKIASASIGTAHIGNAVITTAKIADGQITNAKIVNLSAEKILAGTISATISLTSPIIKTATSGARIEISKDDNFIRIYDSSGIAVGTLGESNAVTFGTILALIRDSSNNNLHVSNSGSGYAINSVGESNFSGGTGRSAIRAFNLGIGVNSHAIVFEAASTGGKGVLGVAAASGGYCLYMNSGTIGPFTGAHPGLIKSEDATEIGDILTDERVLARIDIDNTITEVARSNAANQKSVIGVLSKRSTEWKAADIGLPNILSSFEGSYHYAVVNAVGEGQINVCGLGGDLEPGDYICSSDMPGKGQRQNTPDGSADDVKRRRTVARCREAVTFSAPNDWKRVACIYECG